MTSKYYFMYNSYHMAFLLIMGGDSFPDKYGCLNIGWEFLHLFVSFKLLFLESPLVLFTPDPNRALERFWADVEAICVVKSITQKSQYCTPFDLLSTYIDLLCPRSLNIKRPNELRQCDKKGIGRKISTRTDPPAPAKRRVSRFCRMSLLSL